MRFLALALFVVAAATCCSAQATKTVEFEKSAERAEAPFTAMAHEMMEESGLWGAHRAARSSDVVIMNTSQQPFKLNMTWCAQGKLTKGLLPADRLNAKSSVVSGMESTIYLEGVQCTVLYRSSVKPESWFSLMTHVPFHGDNVVYASSSPDLKISSIVGHGNNNQVMYTIKDSSSGSRQAGGAPFKKPKGNRNKFVRSSKSGSRSRQY